MLTAHLSDSWLPASHVPIRRMGFLAAGKQGFVRVQGPLLVDNPEWCLARSKGSLREAAVIHVTAHCFMNGACESVGKL